MTQKLKKVSAEILELGLKTASPLPMALSPGVDSNPLEWWKVYHVNYSHLACLAK